MPGIDVIDRTMIEAVRATAEQNRRSLSQESRSIYRTAWNRKVKKEIPVEDIIWVIGMGKHFKLNALIRNLRKAILRALGTVPADQEAIDDVMRHRSDVKKRIEDARKEIEGGKRGSRRKFSL